MRGLRYILLFLAFVGCDQRGPMSQLDHDPGRALNDSAAFQWISTSDDDYFDIVEKNTKGVDRQHAVPASNGVTPRLQFWVNAIDSMLRAKQGTKFDSVPKPIAKVITSRVPNAFVTPEMICTSFDVVIDGAQDPTLVAPAISFDRAAKAFSTQWDDPLPCVPSTLDADTQLKLIAWQFAPYPECRYTVQGTTIHLPQTCLSSDNSDMTIRHGKKLAVYAISNQITILSNLITLMTETQMVAIVAHELGHYYMAHLITPFSEYGYFYYLGTHNPNTKPVPDSGAQALGKKLIDAYTNSVDFSAYNPVPGQRYNSFLFTVVQNIAGALSTSQCTTPAAPCTSTCAVLQQFFNDPATSQVLGGFPSTAPSTAGVALYQKFEQLTYACATRITLSTSVGPSFVHPSVVANSVQNADSSLATALSPIPSDGNLETLLEHLTSSIALIQTKQTTDLDAVLTEVMNSGLNRYTREQEADELSAEWTNNIGIDPASLATAMITFASLPVREQHAAFGEVTGDKCKSLCQNGWKDSQGHYVIVPVADWEDIHHSPCFRAFNISREIAAHGLTTFSSVQAPQPPGAAWGDIVQSLSTLESQLPPGDDTQGGTGVIDPL